MNHGLHSDNLSLSMAGSQMFEALKHGKTKQELEMRNILADISVAEPLFISPDTSVVAECPKSPSSRVSQPRGEWASLWPPSDPLRQVDVQDNTFGFSTSNSSTCHRLNGADNGDTIDYSQQAYTVKFGVITLLKRISTDAVLENFDANGDGNMSNPGLSTNAKSGGARLLPSFCILFSFVLYTIPGLVQPRASSFS